MEVIQFVDPTGQAMVARVPRQGTSEIRLGSELVVEESQQAVFLWDGRALDTFGPGRHTLATANLPFLIRVLEPPLESDSPFEAAVVFASLRTFTDLKWGTRERVDYHDSELGRVGLRAFGTLAVRVGDPRQFVNQLVAPRDLYTNDGLEDFFRAAIVARLTDVVGDGLPSIFDLNRFRDELGNSLAARVADDLSGDGLELVDLAVLGIKPPKDVQKRIDERGVVSVATGARETPSTGEVRPSAAPPAGGVGGVAGTTGSGVHSSAAAAEGGAGQVTFCHQCGHQLPAEARFCPACGTKVARR